MGMRAAHATDASGESGELTLAALRWQNEVFRGQGGVSEEIRPLGFRPAFYDMDSGKVHPSRFAGGALAPMHVLDGLPGDLIACRLPNGRVTAARPGVVAGFERLGHFYTRAQAAHAAAQMQARADLFSHPEHQRELLGAWAHFIVDEAYPEHLLRPVVEGSWHRCHGAELDPELAAAPLVLAQEAARERHPELRAAAGAVLARAGDVLADSGSLAVLAASDGVIVDASGDHRIRDQAEDCHLVVGGLWSEQAVGTNAIGTALAEAQPVQLFGAEHYCDSIKRWTCSAEVIRDPHDGQVVGVLDISGLTESYRRYALDFAMTGARLIERHLSSAYFRARQAVLAGTDDLFRHWHDTGLLAFDRGGRLVRANREAHRALSRLAIALELTPQTRVRELDLDTAGGPPPWADALHRQPILAGRRVVGTLIVLADN